MDNQTSSSQGQKSAGGEGAVPPQLDLNLLASIVKQHLHRQQSDGQQHDDSLGNSKLPAQSSSSTAAGLVRDPQSMMEQIAQLTKTLEEERAKSKLLTEDKKKEMSAMYDGIKNYIQGLEVKDPTSKDKFLEGLGNMAKHGVPNGIYDIMVSASARNAEHVKAIEDLSRGYQSLRDRYEGSGQSFAQESSRFVDPALKIMEAGTKRKEPETEHGKVPIGMWDAFGEDIAKIGYMNQPDLFSASETAATSSSMMR